MEGQAHPFSAQQQDLEGQAHSLSAQRPVLEGPRIPLPPRVDSRQPCTLNPHPQASSSQGRDGAFRQSSSQQLDSYRERSAQSYCHASSQLEPHLGRSAQSGLGRLPQALRSLALWQEIAKELHHPLPCTPQEPQKGNHPQLLQENQVKKLLSVDPLKIPPFVEAHPEGSGQRRQDLHPITP